MFIKAELKTSDIIIVISIIIARAHQNDVGTGPAHY